MTVDMYKSSKVHSEVWSKEFEAAAGGPQVEAEAIPDWSCSPTATPASMPFLLHPVPTLRHGKACASTTATRAQSFYPMNQDSDETHWQDWFIKIKNCKLT